MTIASPPAEGAREHQGSLFALANGALGVRGGIEEQPDAGGDCFMGAVFDRIPISYHERFTGFAGASDTRVPVSQGTQILVELEDSAALTQIVDYEYVLDLARGESTRRTRWRTTSGATLEVTAERVVAEKEAAFAIRFRLTSIDYAGRVTFRSLLREGRKAAAQGADPRVGAADGARLTTQACEAAGLEGLLVQTAASMGVSIACAQVHRAALGELTVAEPETTAGGCCTKVHAHLTPGQSLALEKVVAFAIGGEAERENLSDQARDLARRHLAAGFDVLSAQRAAAFGAFWDAARIDAPHTADLEVALRYNLFQLRQNAPADGRVGIAAKGLSGEGYEGHCFWDAETFVLPVLAVTAPELARSHLLFRAGTLDKARRHAREMAHARGALFPWRTIAGDENSAYFPSGSAQYHINSAIAFAVQTYDRAVGDDDFLADHGAEIVFETARIWLQVGNFNARRGGAFCINGVTGPDEYTALIDNDFYTNRMAKAHLEYACELVERLRRERPQRAEVLLAQLAIQSEEIAEWRRAAEAMYLPLDEVLGIHPQDDTFLDKPRWDFEGTRDLRPLLLNFHPLALYRHQVCKQASVVLAHILCGTEDVAQKRRDFTYYEGVTVHDSTLSPSSFAILAADVGETEKAAAYLRETSFIDLQNLHGNTDHGLHLAAAAGSWLSVVWGWGGFRPLGEIPRFRPIRSPALPSYGFRLWWRGRRLGVQVGAEGVDYTLVAGEPLIIDHAGARLALSPGKTVRAPLVEPSRADAMLVRRPPRRPIQAAIFDLDGVLTDTAQAHYRAWKKLADEIGIAFDEQANEALKGVDRLSSLDLILSRTSRVFSPAERRALAERKNEFYLALIRDFGPKDLFPGAREALEGARQAGLSVALASASRNAQTLIERLGVKQLFDHVVDAASVARGKPDPEIYLRAAAALGVAPGFCVGIEDAQAGIGAVRAAGLYAVGVGDPGVLHEADAVVPHIETLSWPRLLTQQLRANPPLPPQRQMAEAPPTWP